MILSVRSFFEFFLEAVFFDLFEDIRVFAEDFGDNGVQDDVRIRDALVGSEHSEFELVAGKGEETFCCGPSCPS